MTNIVRCESVESGNSPTSLVLIGVLESGTVAPGMLVKIPFNQALSMTVPICEVVQTGESAVGLVLDCLEPGGPELVEAMNLVGDRLEIVVDEDGNSSG